MNEKQIILQHNMFIRKFYLTVSVIAFFGGSSMLLLVNFNRNLLTAVILFVVGLLVSYMFAYGTIFARSYVLFEEYKIVIKVGFVTQEIKWTDIEKICIQRLHISMGEKNVFNFLMFGIFLKNNSLLNDKFHKASKSTMAYWTYKRFLPIENNVATFYVNLSALDRKIELFAGNLDVVRSMDTSLDEPVATKLVEDFKNKYNVQVLDLGDITFNKLT